MARRAAVLFLSLLFTVVALNGGISQATYGFPAGSHDRGEPRPALEWALVNTTEVEAIPVYHVTSGWVGPVEAWMTARAFGLGVTSSPELDLDGRVAGSYFGFREGERRFATSFREGDWSYQDGSEDGGGARDEFPSDDDLTQAASDFLVDNGLSPEDLGDAAVSISDEGDRTRGTCRVGFGCDVVILSLPVVFARNVEGLPAFGQGAGLAVSFDATGDVVRVRYHWTPLQKGHNEPLVPLDEGMRRAESTEALVEGMHGCTEARMTEQRITYFVPGATQDADWAFPVYEFGGVCTAARGEELQGLVGTPVVVHVPAVG